MVVAADRQAQDARILELVDRHRKSEYRSLGIVCKTVTQAGELYRTLSASGVDLTFLDYESTRVQAGIITTSAHMRRGWSSTL